MTGARLTRAEAVGFFVAAMRAVAADGPHRVEFHSGQELWDWVAGGDLTGELSETQRATVKQVLDGMLRERVAGLP